MPRRKRRVRERDRVRAQLAAGSTGHPELAPYVAEVRQTDVTVEPSQVPRNAPDLAAQPKRGRGKSWAWHQITVPRAPNGEQTKRVWVSAASSADAVGTVKYSRAYWRRGDDAPVPTGRILAGNMEDAIGAGEVDRYAVCLIRDSGQVVACTMAHNADRDRETLRAERAGRSARRRRRTGAT